MDRFTQAKQDGINAEQRAKQYLSEQGLSFIEQNYRVKLGEIDLIFKQNDTLVFVEVKYRQQTAMDMPLNILLQAKEAK